MLVTLTRTGVCLGQWVVELTESSALAVEVQLWQWILSWTESIQRRSCAHHLYRLSQNLRRLKLPYPEGLMRMDRGLEAFDLPALERLRSSA